MKYIVFAENTTYYSIEVDAKSADEANKIADESDGGDWTENGCGKWIVNDELTMRKPR
jgi:hypothetical protein